MSERWNRIDPASLLPLVGVRRMSRQFGFLLRHYWLPATELTYLRTTGGNEPVTIVRRPARCDADVCCWRETVGGSTVFCIYDRSEQTFRTREIHCEKSEPEEEKAARVQAFLHQPILTPLLPIPLGFQWHVATEDGDYMDLTLDSETRLGDMPVLFIRRKGRFTDQIGTVQREGITAYALERSVVLEDRTRDVLVETGLETRTVTKLIQSRMPEPACL